MKIGIFDSGIGGLSVLHQAMIIMPEADYIFYADVDNVPYGEKTKEEVRKLVDHAVGFLVDKGCQAIVLACNTATSAAISYLREKYKLPIIGIEPAVKPAVEHIHESGKRVMVVSTPVTAKGEKLKKSKKEKQRAESAKESPKVDNSDRHLCKSCKFRSNRPEVNNCDYVAITKHSRGCKVEECTKYEKGNRVRAKDMEE